MKPLLISKLVKPLNQVMAEMYVLLTRENYRISDLWTSRKTSWRSSSIHLHSLFVEEGYGSISWEKTEFEVPRHNSTPHHFNHIHRGVHIWLWLGFRKLCSSANEWYESQLLTLSIVGETKVKHVKLLTIFRVRHLLKIHQFSLNSLKDVLYLV